MKQRSLTEQVGDLTTCPSLIRIDLSQNAIQDTSFATTCQQIKWLSLANNPVTDLRPLECLTNLQARLLYVHSQLPQCMYRTGHTAPQGWPDQTFNGAIMQVLNVGHAKLAGKVRIEGLDQLGALILNDNQITAVSGKARLCSAKMDSMLLPPDHQHQDCASWVHLETLTLAHQQCRA